MINSKAKEIVMKKYLILLIIYFCFCCDEPLPQPTKPNESQNVGIWGYAVGNTLQKHRINYWKKVIPKLKVLCISGFQLDRKGRLKFRTPEKEILSIARKHHVKIYPMITFRSGNDGILFLKDGGSRNIAVLKIAKFVQEYKYDGIHIDFEYMPPSLIVNFKEFLENLKSKLTKDGKILSMALFPQIDFPKKLSAFHNIQELSNSTDEFVLMSYDYHGSKSKVPGPVTSFDWTQKNLDYILQFVSPDKLWLGVPAYGYEWNTKTKRTKVITERNGSKKIINFKYKRHQSGCIYYKYKNKRNEIVEVYFSDRETRERLKLLVEKYKLKGMGIWRLRFETEL